MDKVFNLYGLQTWRHSVVVYEDALLQEVQEVAIATGVRPYKCYFIPTKSDQRHIPIQLSDGYGSIILTSRPEQCTKLIVNEVEIGEIFDVSYF
jgi:hypothetical protein